MPTTFEFDDIGPWIAKAPTEVLDYGLDWNAPGELWLGSDTIASSAWTVDAGLTKGATSNTLTTASVWLSGGALGTSYTVTNTITTAGGRTGVRSFRVVIVAR